MFERFTADARQAVILAQEEARTIGHRHIGTEHLLLALAAEGAGTGSQALHEHGADPDTLRAAVRRLSPARSEPEPVGAGAGPRPGPRRRGLLARLRGTGGGHVPFTKRCKQALEQSLRVALDRKHTSIDSGHVLLGLLRIPESTAGRVLADSGIDAGDLRATAERIVDGSGN
ncbi:hypothetical protein FZ103_04600 [Streptomonospora sp. PA3]|uniref:Clp protease N-terminal domain-containing protein n=1 Tax=Streptomonospora sp. PA3 TaxID=2607326 RepID=UPI0012DE22F7|nr:Clp protease N-terminal domain-containing protein [Streptomonospora sp. PA3]MUL40465.1 hypothetical protein [Streptomonospora sp. PA3]